MDLKKRLAVEVKEREDFGSIVKLKKVCKPEVDRYIARLKRLLSLATDEIDKLPVTGKDVVPKLAKLKAQRALLKSLITELEGAEEIYHQKGENAAELQDQLKKQNRRKEITYKSVPPEKKARQG